ncbi:methyltransferase, FxLD system [Micromonospora sp. NPDC051141]|uniref:methyltransferase, FxLD system n=1 Tax=Micromonospora sp. NPDC051141 TaxID=3364284 RepID=UPI0037BC7F01
MSQTDTDIADRAAELRAALVSSLRARGNITSELVEAAVRRVPRERFMPAGTDLAVAYGVDNSVVTKRNHDGVAISSVSAAYIQARMLEQAELAPGMTVLEVGSGGLNAAYLAEIVGPGGRVVSVDIDPDVTDRAATLLDATGYGSRVRVLVADAEHGVPDEGPFDAIIITVGAWDIAPALLDQLAEGGVIVLPLIMNAVTRTIGFRRDGDHLISTSVEVAGFVPMQGDGAHPDRVFLLPDGDGRHVRLLFDSDAPDHLVRRARSPGPSRRRPRRQALRGVVRRDRRKRGVVRRPAPVVRVVPARLLPRLHRRRNRPGRRTPLVPVRRRLRRGLRLPGVAARTRRGGLRVRGPSLRPGRRTRRRRDGRADPGLAPRRA